MARKISVQGKLTGIPGMYSQGIEPAGPLSPDPLAQGVVLLIATSDGGIKPQTPLLLRNARAIAALGDGNLGKGATVLFHPSRDDRRLVKGASAVLVIRPELATQASTQIQNGSAANLFALKSAPYGLLANGLARTIEAGTLGGPGRKMTIHKSGQSDEVFDDLGFLPAMIVRYTGNGTTATMTITPTSLATTLAGDESDGSADLAVPFATYNTITKIADYINAQTGYEAVIVTNQPDSRFGADLDYVTAANVKTKTGDIAFADATTDAFTGNTISGLAVGDVVKVGDEYVYIKTAGGATGTAIRGYLDSTPAAHSPAEAGVVYTALTEVVKRMMDTANNASARVVADARTSAVGTPAASSKTYLTGATQPAVTSADYTSALEAIGNQGFDFLVVDDMSATVHATITAWLAERWGAAANEVQAHLGAYADETISQIRSRCKAMQDPNSSLWYQQPTRDGVQYSPWMEACFAAGIQAGMAPGTPLTNKSMRLEALDQASTIKVNGADAETSIEIGASFARYDGDDFRIVRCLSTWTNDDVWYLISPNVRYAIARVEKLIRSYIKLRHFGKRGVSGEAATIKSTIIDALEDAESQGLIVAGARRVNGVLEAIPAFDPDQIFVERLGNAINYETAYTPVDGNDFFISSNRVAEWVDAA